MSNNVIERQKYTMNETPVTPTAAPPPPPAAPYQPAYTVAPPKTSNWENLFSLFFITLAFSAGIWVGAERVHDWIHPPEFKVAAAYLDSLGFKDAALDLGELERVCRDSNDTARACVRSYSDSRQLSRTNEPNIVSNALVSGKPQ